MINKGKFTLVQQLRLLSLIVVIGLVLSITAHAIALWAGFDVSASLVTKIDFLNPLNWAKISVLCVIEEIVFRGVLSLDVKAVCVSIFFWIFMLLSYLSNTMLKIDVREEYRHILLIGLYALLSFCITYQIYRKCISFIVAMFRFNYNLLFWTLCILFALAHVDNYVNHNSAVLIYLVLVVPQLAMGGFLAVVRIRNGIVSSAIIHFLADVWFFSFGLESRVTGHAVIKIAVGVFLSVIFLFGSFQVKLCRNVAYALMRPSSRILENC